eukprot:3431345-Pleurochrysis_carterae.AAC.2
MDVSKVAASLSGELLRSDRGSHESAIAMKPGQWLVVQARNDDVRRHVDRQGTRYGQLDLHREEGTSLRRPCNESCGRFAVSESSEAIDGTMYTRGDSVIKVDWWVREPEDHLGLTYSNWEPEIDDVQSEFFSS